MGRGMLANHIARTLNALVVFVALALHSVATEAVLARPGLDGATYRGLISELVTRIPSDAPEWTDHDSSDPGFTLLDLFRFLDDKELDTIITEYHGRDWWVVFEIDSEVFLGELAYSLLEAGLVIVLPPNEPAPKDWPTVYSVELDQTFAELLVAARVPEPTTLLLLGIGFAGLGVARRKSLSTGRAP